MKCREKCGACCIAPSISSSLPGMPEGKPAGIPCLHLDEDYRCLIYDHPDKPSVCDGFKASPDVCGTSRREAMILLTALENGDA
jgi:Fe-S-cluster containining protein